VPIGSHAGQVAMQEGQLGETLLQSAKELRRNYIQQMRAKANMLQTSNMLQILLDGPYNEFAEGNVWFLARKV
jgi:hypothetical protein